MVFAEDVSIHNSSFIFSLFILRMYSPPFYPFCIFASSRVCSLYIWHINPSLLSSLSFGRRIPLSFLLYPFQRYVFISKKISAYLLMGYTLPTQMATDFPFTISSTGSGDLLQWTWVRQPDSSIYIVCIGVVVIWMDVPSQSTFFLSDGRTSQSSLQVGSALIAWGRREKVLAAFSVPRWCTTHEYSYVCLWIGQLDQIYQSDNTVTHIYLKKG